MFETSLLFPAESPPPEKSVWSKVRFLWSTSALWILIALTGLVSTAWGSWIISSNSIKSSDEIKPLVVQNPTQSSSVFIDVSGAVENPGVYQLKEGERVASAIAAAGGISLLADSSYINTSFNLAERIKDGQKIYIPFEGEQSQLNTFPVLNENEPLTQLPINTESSNELISINTATENQLDTLPRIGEVTAEKIITARPYLSVDELVSKKIISEGVFEEIKELIKI